MGVNGQQPTTQQGMQTQSNLQKIALSPYQGSAQGGGLAQGAAQLAAALMAHSKFGNTQNKFARPGPGIMPTAVTQPISLPTGTPTPMPPSATPPPGGLPGIGTPLAPNSPLLGAPPMAPGSLMPPGGMVDSP